MNYETQLQLTKHAQERMARRGVRQADVETVMEWGRAVIIRGATIHALGRKEVSRYRETYGVDLSRYEGMHVVCAHDGGVMTVYRNRDFKGLRRERGRFQRRVAARAALPGRW